MAYLIGLVLALAVAGFGRGTGFDRDRAFYPTVTVVIALYYVLFAVLGSSMQALAVLLVRAPRGEGHFPARGARRQATL